ESLAAGVVLVVQRCRGDALGGGPLQAARIRSAGDDGGDVGRPALVAAGFGQRLHVAAPPRDQDDKAALGKLCVRQDKESKDCPPRAPERTRFACARGLVRHHSSAMKTRWRTTDWGDWNKPGIQNCKLSLVKPSLRIYRSLPPPDRRAPCALTIGNFDGVHRGHQAMLARVCQAARERGLTPSVMTFEPHPREYFATLNRRPELAPTRISGLRDKLQALAAAGIEQVVVERFDARLAEMSANAFIEDLLVAGLQTRWLLVGEDFRYGHKRSGDIDL